jgi:hypothetical protein
MDGAPKPDSHVGTVPWRVRELAFGRERLAMSNPQG